MCYDGDEAGDGDGANRGESKVYTFSGYNDHDISDTFHTHTHSLTHTHTHKLSLTHTPLTNTFQHHRLQVNQLTDTLLPPSDTEYCPEWEPRVNQTPDALLYSVSHLVSTVISADIFLRVVFLTVNMSLINFVIYIILF